MQLTKHGKKRMRERVGASDKGAERNAAKAYRNGIRPEQAFGELGEFLDKKQARQRHELRVFRDKLYLFDRGRLVTVYDLPESVALSIRDSVDERVYERYIAGFNFKPAPEDPWEAAKSQLKQGPTRDAFWGYVYKYDASGFLSERMDVEVDEVVVSGNKAEVFYSTRGLGYVDLSDLASYLRESTHLRTVKLTRSKRSRYAQSEAAMVYTC